MSGSERLDDREAIRELTHRYALSVDRFRLDDVLAVYADDAVLDLSALGMPRLEGAAALREFYTGSIEGMASQFHVITNHVIAFDGPDAANGTHYVLANAQLKDGTKILVHGLHEDTYTRTGTGWKVATRNLSMLVPPVVEGPAAG